MFSSWKINSLLGHQHILVHKISFSLLKRKIRQRYKVDLCDSLPLGLRTVLLIDLQPTFWNLWFLNSYREKLCLHFRQAFLSASF